MCCVRITLIVIWCMINCGCMSLTTQWMYFDGSIGVDGRYMVYSGVSADVVGARSPH